MKRANGTGSVYKRTDKKRRKPFVAKVTIGADPNTGRPIRKSLGSFEKATEARQAIEEYLKGPNLYMSKGITFGEMWDLMIKQKENLGVSSAANYNMTKNRCQHIWATPMQDLRLIHLQAIVDNCGLSVASKKQIKVTLNAVFSLAYANDFILKNYAELIQLPLLGKSEMHRPFTTQELQTLWANSDDDVVRIMLIYIYTGMRPIELMEMPVENVHLKERYMVGGVKTEAGKNRRIPIANCIYPFVKAFYERNVFKRKYLIHINNSTTLRHKLKPMFERLKIEYHRPHDGRHTFITMASNYRIDEVVVKRIVGHSKGRNVTQDVYTHKTQEQLLHAVNTLPYGPNMLLSPEEKGGATAEVHV